MKFTDYDLETGQIKGFYDEEIHGESIPKTATKITDDIWLFLLNNQGMYAINANKTIEIIDDLQYLRKIEPEALPQQTPTDQERIEALEEALLEVILNG